MTEAISVQAAINEFDEAGLYFGHGTDNASDEAAWLVVHVLNIPFESLSTVYRQELTPAQYEQISLLANRRIQTRVPLAYLIHEAWFCALKFYVDQRVLIPRSPLAELIMDHFQPWIDPAAVNAILDIGTGSGCIAVACALAFPASHVDAADISPEALDVARINIKQHALQDRIELIESDMFSGLGGRRYDIVISNPPYVDAEDIATMPAEYLHEPQLALASGPDGLDHAERILHAAAAHLNPGGILIVEVGNSAQALVQRYPAMPFTWLEFEHGGQGVFLLYEQDLVRFK